MASRWCQYLEQQRPYISRNELCYPVKIIRIIWRILLCKKNKRVLTTTLQKQIYMLSLNKTAQRYDYIITFIKKNENHYLLFESPFWLDLCTCIYKFQSHSPKDKYWQFWLKLTHWIIYLPWKKSVAIHQMVLASARFTWNWP